MNGTQTALLGAFDVAMQTLCNLANSKETTKTQFAAAYGGACALFILVQQHTDINEIVPQARRILNESAHILGLPETN